MTKTKRRERFYLWLDYYERFKAMANTKGVSASELFRDLVEEFQPPNERPKKGRNLTIDERTNAKLQAIADEWFSSSTTGVPGNRSDVANYIIMQALKNE